MKTILFIGHHKVGSTSLQDFLARNSVALARAGILYPSTDFEGMSLMLAAAAGRVDPDVALPINAREPHNALAFRMLAQHGKGSLPPYHKGLPSTQQMFRAIRQQVRFFQPHTMILAAEVFANFAPASHELIEALVDNLPGDEITIIATLRRIDEYLASWHGQRLKFGHRIDPLSGDGLRPYFGRIHFDFRLMLEGWIDTLPQAKVILRNYGDVRTGGGSVADFMAQTGLDLPEGLTREQRTNESLHRGIYEIARCGNEALSDMRAGHLRATLRNLTPELDLPPSNDIELFGSANRQQMVDRFEPIHDYLGQISGQSPFMPDLAEARQTLPVAEEDVFRHVLTELRKRPGLFEDNEIRAFLDALDTRPADPA